MMSHEQSFTSLQAVHTHTLWRPEALDAVRSKQTYKYIYIHIHIIIYIYCIYNVCVVYIYIFATPPLYLPICF